MPSAAAARRTSGLSRRRGAARSGEAGLVGSRELGFVGPSSFDVAADGSVAVLDQVNGRVERWSRAGVKATTVEVSGGLADFALEPGGAMDVLEPPSRVSPAPVLRSFRG